MKRVLAGLAVVVVLAAPLTACSDSKPVSGTVVSKNTDRECSTKKSHGKKRSRSCHTEYELQVRTESGDRKEVDVSSGDYADCAEGAKYPKCTTR
ncbi:hypothetical protein [Streptomyces sp. VRA16 Mangrove soil]|uniref:hypothetical protein n=1 Tax=Streptomyces sp. VRA16 Mangrove soil TaxID=2817434 RepID=UPI001A9E52A5|nr:hypothetical protein [Streptomyces sp. VRA16 Mangrove soil]MBO1337433.1 hypothetical protein [Streptomyces sp. VRA16 Mangrove soil]